MDYLSRKKVIKHVLATGVIGDSVGTLLANRSGSERTKAYQKAIGLTKSTATKPHAIAPGIFGTVMFGTFNSLRKRTRVSVAGIQYEALLYGGAFGAGLFVAFEELGFSDLLSLSQELCAWYKIDPEDARLFTLLMWLVSTLISEGYLRGSHIRTADELKLLSPELSAVLGGLVAHQFDKRYMTLQVAPADITQNLTPYEQVVAKTMFYLFQAFSGWNTKPRFALHGVVSHDPSTSHELFFVYSVLCVASEHHYLLYTRPLHEQNVLAQRVTALFENV